MKRISILPFVLVASLFFPATSPAFEIGARGYYWFPSLDGTVKVDEAGIVGSTIDFDEDLGIEDEDYPSFEVFIGGGKHHLSVAYTDIDYSGRKKLTRTVFFKGQAYPVNDVVMSSIAYKELDLRYQYDFLTLDSILGGFSLGGVVQVKYLDGDVQLKAEVAGIDERGFHDSHSNARS